MILGSKCKDGKYKSTTDSLMDDFDKKENLHCNPINSVNKVTETQSFNDERMNRRCFPKGKTCKQQFLR